MTEDVLCHAALPGEQVLPRCRCLAKLQRFLGPSCKLRRTAPQKKRVSCLGKVLLQDRYRALCVRAAALIDKKPCCLFQQRPAERRILEHLPRSLNRSGKIMRRIAAVDFPAPAAGLRPRSLIAHDVSFPSSTTCFIA
jgi:hypothetical protein